MMGIGSPSCFIHDAWKLTELVRWSAGRSVVQIHFHFPLARWIHSAYNHVERYSWKAYGHVILKTMDASNILFVLPQLYIFTLNFKHNTLGLGIKTQLSPTHLNVSYCASWINSVSYLLALCWAQFLKIEAWLLRFWCSDVCSAWKWFNVSKKQQSQYRHGTSPMAFIQTYLS